MAFDTYLFFTGGDPKIEGETTDAKYKDKKAFEIFSFSWGVSNPTTVGSGTGGMSAGKASISSFNIMKKTDAASPALFLACASGSHYPTMEVVMRKSSGANKLEFLTYTFSEVLVESVQWSGSSGGDDTPTESVSFAFGKVEVSYQPQDATGAAEGGAKTASWDQTKNTK
jgi:type VI secretion system secreted protein Hcp